MSISAFSDIAARYERDSLIQKTAAERLFSVLSIGEEEDVLDLGCGTGSLTRRIRELTSGRVLGVDPCPDMIEKAAALSAGSVAHGVMGAENMALFDEFDVIFCNSAIQWWRDHVLAVRKCYAALRQGGRVGIQAPARRAYCPNFIAAVRAVERHALTRSTFATFRPPWFFLETAEEYAGLFSRAGFTVPFSRIEQFRTLHPLEEVLTIFESGAAAGYLNEDFYSAPIDDDYRNAFRRILRHAFECQADCDGNVELVFNRVYLVAVKG